jgi:XFP-like protein
VFDNPDLLACCVIGDGEAETGPLAASWHSNKFLNPVRDGAVLPVLHLNGYKIANPTVLALGGRASAPRRHCPWQVALGGRGEVADVPGCSSSSERRMRRSEEEPHAPTSGVAPMGGPTETVLV